MSQLLAALMKMVLQTCVQNGDEILAQLMTIFSNVLRNLEIGQWSNGGTHLYARFSQ